MAKEMTKAEYKTEVTQIRDMITIDGEEVPMHKVIAEIYNDVKEIKSKME